MALGGIFGRLSEMEHVPDYNAKSLVSVPESVLLLLSQDKRMWQRCVLACLVLIRNEYFWRESRKYASDIQDIKRNYAAEKPLRTTDRTLYIATLDPSVLVKSSTGRVQSAGKASGDGTDDSFLPGLPDDLALACLGWCSRSDFPSLARLNKKFNQLILSDDMYKVRRKLGNVEHWVYLFCSMMPWIAFDPSAMRWMRLPMMPCDECFRLSDKESLAVGTQLLVFGREFDNYAIWMYTVLEHKWTKGPSMEYPRCLFGSGSSGEIAIVAGGCNNSQVLKCAELYNSETGMWEKLPDMSAPRKLSSGFFMDGEFYVIGGVSDGIKSLTCGEVYNLKTRTWRTIADMYPGGTSVHQSPPLVAVVKDQLYAADPVINVVKKYSKENKSWDVVKELPVRADSSNGWGLAFKSCGDRLLVISGHRGARGEVIVLHSWRPGGEASSEGWEVLSVKERYGVFICNCAVMGC